MLYCRPPHPQGIDLLFTNAGEAAALLRHEPGAAQGAAAAQAAPHRATGEQLALQLGPHCGVVVVTDGDRGSHVTALGQLHCVPPCWLEDAPVDTCGAGEGTGGSARPCLALLPPCLPSMSHKPPLPEPCFLLCAVSAWLLPNCWALHHTLQLLVPHHPA